MHFHLPKPLHGWREFAGEVGIIVIGVLIALAAEQVLQNYEWRQRVTDARGALDREVAQDEAAAQERIDFGPCATRHLDEVQSLIMSSGAQIERPLLVTRYYTIIRPWSQNVWRTMSASDVLEHMPQTEMLNYGNIYDDIALIHDEMMSEQDSISDLSILTTLHGPFDAVTRDRLLAATSRARRENSTIIRDSRQLLEAAASLHVPADYKSLVSSPGCHSLHEFDAAIPQ
jgi:hypothetical protein